MADADKGKPLTERTAPAVDANPEPFLSRWSRLKREIRDHPPEQPPSEPVAVDPQAPAPALPALDGLTMDSDYRVFFHPKVDEEVRRAALKKLFSDPRFNVMDGLDVYIDDYSKTEPIPAAMLAGLRQARNILQWAKEDTDERERAKSAAANPVQTTVEPPAEQTPRDELGAASLSESLPAPSPQATGERTNS